jgi:hypothetical protein
MASSNRREMILRGRAQQLFALIDSLAKQLVTNHLPLETTSENVHVLASSFSPVSDYSAAF